MLLYINLDITLSKYVAPLVSKKNVQKKPTAPPYNNKLLLIIIYNINFGTIKYFIKDISSSSYFSTPPSVKTITLI